LQIQAIATSHEIALANIYTRGFDNCFEMFDGTTVVRALMHEAVSGDVLLERGIGNMGKAVWPHWLEVYEQARQVCAGYQPAVLVCTNQQPMTDRGDDHGEARHSYRRRPRLQLATLMRVEAATAGGVEEEPSATTRAFRASH
jgi:hypothetical protein